VFAGRETLVRSTVDQSHAADVAVKPPTDADQSCDDAGVVKTATKCDVRADAPEPASTPDQPSPTLVDEATDDAESTVVHLGYMNAASLQQILSDSRGAGPQSANQLGSGRIESSDSDEECEPSSASRAVKLAPAPSDDGDVGPEVGSPSHVTLPTATGDRASVGVAKPKHVDEIETDRDSTDDKTPPRVTASSCDESPEAFVGATDSAQKPQPVGQDSAADSVELNGGDAVGADISWSDRVSTLRPSADAPRQVRRRSRISKVESTEKPPVVELTVDASFEPSVVTDLKHSELVPDGRSAFDELREYLTKTRSSGGGHPMPVAASRVSMVPGPAIDNLKFFLRNMEQA
jgi:hypothetical protein